MAIGMAHVGSRKQGFTRLYGTIDIDTTTFDRSCWIKDARTLGSATAAINSSAISAQPFPFVSAANVTFEGDVTFQKFRQIDPGLPCLGVRPSTDRSSRAVMYEVSGDVPGYISFS